MPVATIDPNFKRYPLKTALANPSIPDDEDGWIELRPLPFGMILDRQDKTMSMRMKARRPQDRKRKGQDNELPDIDLKNLNMVAVEFDFAYCIGNHNLTDINGNKLDLSSAMAFKSLDPRIGQEISALIDDLNNPEDDEDDAEDFIKPVTSLPTEKTSTSTSKMADLNTEDSMISQTS